MDAGAPETTSTGGGRLLITVTLNLHAGTHSEHNFHFCCETSPLSTFGSMSSQSRSKGDQANQTSTHASRFKNDHFTQMCCGDKAGSYLRLIDSCITRLKAQGPSRTCNESKEEEEEEEAKGTKPIRLAHSHRASAGLRGIKKHPTLAEAVLQAH